MGCRIIDSKRERLIAMLTNSLVPCNGRFPTIIAIITMFLILSTSALSSVLSALLLSAVILLSVLMTILCSKLLSITVLKGEPSSFALELPPYRIPKVGEVIVRSVFDRTLRVLGRAVAVAAPAGLLLWLIANVRISELTLLDILSGALDPIGELLGLDGVILLAFFLALPANEIVIPIILMAYTSSTSLIEYSSVVQLKDILLSNGWSTRTAVCTLVFMLFHFPCSTTLMTIRKESGSVRWTLLAALLPTLIGALLCAMIALIWK